MHRRNQQSRNGLKLANKALLLVSVPLIFELIFLFTLAVLFRETELAAAAQQVHLDPDAMATKKLFIVIGLNFNILLCVYLTLFFVRGQTRRLSTIQDNIKRLQSGIPLNEPLSGNDELTQLDVDFHKFAEWLRNHEGLPKPEIET